MSEPGEDADAAATGDSGGGGGGISEGESEGGGGGEGNGVDTRSSPSSPRGLFCCLDCNDCNCGDVWLLSDIALYIIIEFFINGKI
jgi:hypothetical protein